MSEDSPALEAFIDESIKRSRERGYYPTVFVGMRAKLGTVPTIKQLVQGGDMQSGFKRLVDLGLVDWSIEAAVLRFPEMFSAPIQDAARWRLDQVRPSK